MDACSIVAKETPLGCNSLPTLVTPTSLQQEIPSASNLNSAKVNIISRKWGLTTIYFEEENALSAVQTCFIWPLDGAKAFNQTAWQGWCWIGRYFGKVFFWKCNSRICKKFLKTEKNQTYFIMKVSINQKDPDTIACPICHKDWHKSNLRNHLFYGHHMKTAEVEAALLKIRNPKSGLKTESIKNDRTPCPLCERSFKVGFYDSAYFIIFV